MLRLAALSLIACGLIGPAGLARADVVSPPPPSCPDGSFPREFCHGPPTCEVDSCTTDAECGRGEVCREVPLCARDHNCGGRAGTPIVTHIEGPCPARGTCEGFGTECRRLRVCIAASSVDAGPADAGNPDAGAADSGAADAGGADAGDVRDAGAVDAGGADAGAVDAGAVDAGAVDAGPVDAGRRDAGGGGGSGDGGCGCRVASRADSVGALVVLGLCALPLLKRRRR